MKTFKGLFILFFFRNFLALIPIKKEKMTIAIIFSLLIAAMMLLGISPSIIFEKV